MKILILHDDFPPHNLGGAGVVAFNLAKKIRQTGHDISIITTVQKKEDEGSAEYQGLKIFKIYTNYNLKWRAYLSLYNYQTINQIKKIIKQIKPDIVHAHNVHTYLSYHSLKIAKKNSRAVFLTAHDVMLFHYGKLTEFINFHDLSLPDPKKFNYQINWWQLLKRYKKRYNPFRNMIIRYYLKYIDKIFAISYTQQEVLKQNGITNTAVIYNGLETSGWQMQNDIIENFKKKYNHFNQIVLFSGRITGLKGGEQIVRAMAQVRQYIPQAILMVAGKTNEYMGHIKKLAKKLEVPLLFTGWLNDDELKAAYHISQVVVTPSVCMDCFNLVNLEAMLAKKPVVGSCFGAIPEIVLDNQTGYIVNPFNVKMMAEKITDLLSNPTNAEKFGQAGYQRAKEKFSLDRQVNQTLMWYNKFI